LTCVRTTTDDGKILQDWAAESNHTALICLEVRVRKDKVAVFMFGPSKDELNTCSRIALNTILLNKTNLPSSWTEPCPLS
jgi:hypothetical protein